MNPIVPPHPPNSLKSSISSIDFLQMEPYTGSANPHYTTPQNSTQLISTLIPSFLSLDTDGRVLRLDSLSKILAPGIRLGFITASAQLIERLIRIIEVTSQAPSGFSQSIAYQLLAQHWGHDGFFNWLIYIRSEYTTRRDICCRAIDRYLPKSVMEYTVPSAGMGESTILTSPQAIRDGALHRGLQPSRPARDPPLHALPPTVGRGAR